MGWPASWLHCRVGAALAHLRGMSLLATRVRYVPGLARRGLANARAGMIMCVICRHERLWNTTGWY